MDTIHYLDPASVQFLPTPNSVCLRVVVVGDRCLPAARVYKCFPLSEQDDHLSIQDGSGVELGILKSLDGLPTESRLILDDYLNRRYFTPVILRIISLTQETTMWLWDVLTQRGAATFYIRGVRDSVHEVSQRRWQIHSIDGQRFEIRDFDELDAKSRDLFESLF